MSGKISFHFDDGLSSHYTEAFPIFQEAGVAGCLALMSDLGELTEAQVWEMHSAGWEILCHTITHPRMSEPIDEALAVTEIVESKRRLEEKGFPIRQFITPCSACHPSLLPLLQNHYEGAFTRYTNSQCLPPEQLIIEHPVNPFDLHRACLSGKTKEELYALVDHVVENDAWIVFYEHGLGKGSNITAEGLRDLVAYCQRRGGEILTSSQALAKEHCVTKTLRSGYDGSRCYVHARCAANGEEILMTAQYLNVAGCDDFDCLNVSFSEDGGKTFTPLAPDPVFRRQIKDGLVSVPCDMTPFYHKASGRFLVTGHTALYYEGATVPVPPIDNRRTMPYAVYDAERRCFGPLRSVEMPDAEKYCDCGSGCSQICELANGDLLIPIGYSEKKDGVSLNGKAAVLRCGFDGETIRVLEIGDDIEVIPSRRGIGEASLLAYRGRFYLTIRDDDYGYVAESEDGLHFTPPQVHRFDDGEILPTYNTQSHWFTLGDKAYLVYTRKNGTNDHVFRHRAPLYAAEFLPETLSVKRESEFIVVPERGARLGNFGCCQCETGALVMAAEWMQPAGCEKYGSDNAIWLTEVRENRT